jgi:uncharacterized protein with HEPN domain
MRRDVLLLTEMIEAAEQAQALTGGLTVSDLEADRQRRDALLWNFTVLGEAVGQLSDEIKAQFPQVAWQQPARLRNRIVHGYWSAGWGSPVGHQTSSGAREATRASWTCGDHAPPANAGSYMTATRSGLIFLEQDVAVGVVSAAGLARGRGVGGQFAAVGPGHLLVTGRQIPRDGVVVGVVAV